MVEHVLQRLVPQAAPLCLSVAPGDREAFTDVAEKAMADLVVDERPAHRGPLSGLRAGLHWLAGLAPRIASESLPAPEAPVGGVKWLLLVPCDAPFLPADLVARLLAAADAAGTKLAMARYDGHRQPTFSVWHVDMAAAVDAALAKPERGGLIHLADRTDHVTVDWLHVDPPPFFNVNTPADLDAAHRWLDPDVAEG